MHSSKPPIPILKIAGAVDAIVDVDWGEKGGGEGGKEEGVVLVGTNKGNVRLMRMAKRGW